MANPAPGLLKLHALDGDGLAYISACVQDAIACVADMSYQPRLNRFVMVVTRFRWERLQARRHNGERVRAGLHFENVRQVRTQDIDMSDRDGLLPMLAVSAEEGGQGAKIELLFGGGATIALSTEAVDCRLQDLGAPWPTPSRPDHQL